MPSFTIDRGRRPLREALAAAAVLACKPCCREEGVGSGSITSRIACGCSLPDTIFLAWSDSGITAACKMPDSVITLTRCELADVMCGILYRTDTYTLIDPENGYDGPVTTDDNEAGLACLQAIWGEPGAWNRIQWFCWKSESIPFANSCCDPDNNPVPGHCYAFVTTSGVFYYMVTQYQFSNAINSEDFDASILPDETNCCEFVWSCSVVEPSDPLVDPGCNPALFLEGQHPIHYFNGHERRLNVGAGVYGGGCVASGLPCAFNVGDFDNFDPVVTETYFYGCYIHEGWYVCEHIAHAGYSPGTTPASPGPTADTCTPFYREWTWTAAAGASVEITVSE